MGGGAIENVDPWVGLGIDQEFALVLEVVDQLIPGGAMVCGVGCSGNVVVVLNKPALFGCRGCENGLLGVSAAKEFMLWSGVTVRIFD